MPSFFSRSFRSRAFAALACAGAFGCEAADETDAGVVDAAPDGRADDSGIERTDAGPRPPALTPRDPVALPVDYDRAGTVAALKMRLEAAGFAVDEGLFDFFFVEDCEGLATCYGNNPSSPYGLYFLPRAPDEAPADVASLFERGELTAGWRLREDEAVLWIGRTPPESAYFGFRSYVFQRDGAELFASLGDTLNQLGIGTASSSGGTGAFDHESVVVTTADRNLDAALRGHLVALGLDEGMVNTDTLPREVLEMGLGADADVLTMLFRIALPEDEAAARAWMDAPPAAVLRIRPIEPRAIDGFPLPTLRTRGTGHVERDLTGALDRLGDAIAERAPGGRATPMVPLSLDGFECLEQSRECQGDNRDTIYVISVPTVLEDDDVWWVYGVNHERTGKATYVNVTALDVATRTGVGGLARQELDDTAAAFLPESDAERDLLYAVQVRRHCDGAPACFEIPYDFPGVADGNQVSLAMRPYLEPATGTAPLPSELVVPRVYRVSGD